MAPNLIALSAIFASAVVSVIAQCPEASGLYAVSNYCDRYIECRNGTIKEDWCPDGLVFDARNSKLRFPCDYPTEVDCGDRTQLQPAQSSENCPRRWGLYSDPGDCGIFWNCVDGRAFKITCPEGLAFSTATNRCEYPDETPNCDAEAFLGFRCPTVDQAVYNLFAGNPRFAHGQDCQRFYVCVGGTKPRLLRCPHGQAFNAELNACDDAKLVSGCETYYGDTEQLKP